MKPTLESATAALGVLAKEKLANPTAEGQYEDQLCAPLEGLIKGLAEACGLPRDKVVAVGEAMSLSDFRRRINSCRPERASAETPIIGSRTFPDPQFNE